MPETRKNSILTASVQFFFLFRYPLGSGQFRDELPAKFHQFAFLPADEHISLCCSTAVQPVCICRRTGTIFVGQHQSDIWHDRLGGGTIADAIMDRIIHNSCPFHSNDSNFRKVYDEQKLKKLLDSFKN